MRRRNSTSRMCRSRNKCAFELAEFPQGDGKCVPAGISSELARPALKGLNSYGKYCMASTQAPVNIAILDDYQNVALKLADWSRLQGRSQVTVFNDHVSDPAALVERLKPFEVISVMRERTPLPRSIIEQLPNLKLIASNALRNASIDLATAKEHGITVCGTGYSSTATVELTWALIHALVRNLPA